MDLLHYLTFLRQKKIAYYLILLLVVVFLLLTAVISFIPPSIIDLEFSEEIQEYNHPLLDGFMKSISWFGSTWVAVFLVIGVAILFFIFSYKKESLFVILTFLVSIINYFIKLLINRPRPTEDLVQILVESKHQSFPSGHTSFYVVFFGFVTFLMLKHNSILKSLRYWSIVFCLFLIFSVPFSRIYLGAHWFTDVVAGFVLGLIVLYFLILLYFKNFSERK